MLLRTIYKFHVPVDDTSHQIPGKIVHVGRSPIEASDDLIAVWSEVELDAEGEPSYDDAGYFRVYGTGQPLSEAATHVGTVQTTSYVWHLFDVTPAAS